MNKLLGRQCNTDTSIGKKFTLKASFATKFYSPVLALNSPWQVTLYGLIYLIRGNDQVLTFHKSSHGARCQKLQYCVLNFNLKLTKKMLRHKATLWTNGIMGLCEKVLPCYHYVGQKCTYISHSIVQKQREGKRSSNGLCVSI